MGCLLTACQSSVLIINRDTVAVVAAELITATVISELDVYVCPWHAPLSIYRYRRA